MAGWIKITPPFIFYPVPQQYYTGGVYNHFRTAHEDRYISANSVLVLNTTLIPS